MKKRRVIKETGEWDDNDEQMKAWKQDINDRAIELASLVNGEASPAEGFDAYQGPYAHISDTPKGDVTLWSSEYDGIYRLETYEDWLEGDIETLAKKLNESVKIDWNDLANYDLAYELEGAGNWKYIKVFESSNEIYPEDVDEGENYEDYSAVAFEVYGADKELIDGGMLLTKEDEFDDEKLVKDCLNMIKINDIDIDIDKISIKKIDSEILEEAAKPAKGKKPTKRLVMNQGNVYIFEQSKGSKKSYIVGEDIDKDANTIEKVNKYNNQDEAFTDFFARIGIDPNNELKESLKKATKSKIIKESAEDKVDFINIDHSFKLEGLGDWDTIKVVASVNPVDLEDIAEYEGYESAEDIPMDKEDELLDKWGDIYYYIYNKDGEEVEDGGMLTDEQKFNPEDVARNCLELAGVMDGSKVKLTLEESAYEDCIEDEDITEAKIYTTEDLDKMELGYPVAVELKSTVKSVDGELVERPPIIKTSLFAGKDDDGKYLFYDGSGFSGLSKFSPDFITNSGKVVITDRYDGDELARLVTEMKEQDLRESAEEGKKIEKLEVQILPELEFKWAEGNQKHVANLFGSAEEHTMDFNDFQNAVYKLDQEVQQEDGGYDKVSYVAHIKTTETYSDGSTEVDEDTTYQGRVDCGDGKYGLNYVRIKDLMKSFIQGEPGYKEATIEVFEPKE